MWSFVAHVQTQGQLLDVVIRAGGVNNKHTYRAINKQEAHSRRAGCSSENLVQTVFLSTGNCHVINNKMAAATSQRSKCCVPDITSCHVSFQERKKMVKEAQREKRRTKVPKHVKKRKEKVAKMKKGR